MRKSYRNNLESKAKIYEIRLVMMKNPARKFGGRMYY